MSACFAGVSVTYYQKFAVRVSDGYCTKQSSETTVIIHSWISGRGTVNWAGFNCTYGLSSWISGISLEYLL